MKIPAQVKGIYHAAAILCITLVILSHFRPILQPVVYLDDKLERMLLGPTTTSKKLAREWAENASNLRPGSSYMILERLHWNRDLDIVECSDKFH